MYQEIDLRPFVKQLLRGWYILGSVGLALALLAFLFSSLQEMTYEATALVVVTRARYNLQFDPRFQTITSNPPPFGAYPELAMSDQLLQEVWSQAGIPAGTFETSEDLAAAVNARLGVDSSLIELTVKAPDPEIAAMIANYWAEAFVRHANTLFTSQSDEAVAIFELQLAQAQTNLDLAEQALADFAAQNRTQVISNQLTSLVQLHATYLQNQAMMTIINQYVADLSHQLSQNPAGLSTADQLTALMLQLQAYNNQSQLPFQIDVNDLDSLSALGPNEQISYLNQLQQTLTGREASLNQQLGELEPQILALQQQVQVAQAQQSRLTNSRNVARETFLIISRKLDETRIAAQNVGGLMAVGSQATPPNEPLGRFRIRNTLAGGALGVVLSGSGLLFWGWLAPLLGEIRQERAGRQK